MGLLAKPPCSCEMDVGLLGKSEQKCNPKQLADSLRISIDIGYSELPLGRTQLYKDEFAKFLNDSHGR